MVSIVLVTYNRAKRLKLSIEDILRQTFQDFELIICDDCSPDNTEAICRDFAIRDSRVRYFRHAQNKQMPANLNFGIEQAKYEYVAILHDGDRYRKDLIEQWYNAISTYENVGVVFNSLGDSDSDDKIVNVFQEFPEGVVDGRHLLKSEYFRRSNFSSPIYGEAMVRKSLVQKYGYLKSEYSFYADVDLWMHILHTHDAYYCADTLIKAPVKSFQPQEFEDDIVRFNMMLFDMSRKHRLTAFKNSPVKLAAEISVYHLFKFWHFTYVLLLVTKNFSFRYFMDCRKSFGNNFSFFPVWAAFFVLYPVLRPALRTLIARKESPGDKALSEKSDVSFSRIEHRS
jgi:glycosyltransferase involved in cell wall biosynthesis